MKPILFNTEMVQAILDGRKTCTRRIAFAQDKLQPAFSLDDLFCCPATVPVKWSFENRLYETWDALVNEPQGVMSRCRYKMGDVLYVRETWLEFVPEHIFDGKRYAYKADETSDYDDELRRELGYKWRPSIHMPKTAARLFLQVTDVRLERLQDITEEDAKKEGAVEVPIPCTTAIDNFFGIWNKTIKPADSAKYGWDANPWVWVIDFERISKEEAEAVG